MNIAEIGAAVIAAQYTAKGMAAEATETAQQTKMEAAKGDMQAVTKLAKIAAKAAEETVSVPDTSVAFDAKA